MVPILKAKCLRRAPVRPMAFSGFRQPLFSSNRTGGPANAYSCCVRRRTWRAPSVAELSGRRLRHQELRVPERREAARAEAPLPHPWNRKAGRGGQDRQRRAAFAGQHRHRRELVAHEPRRRIIRAGHPPDATQYFMIMQDALGRGGSSKPSDGLKGNFPHYRYHDMVETGYRLITEGLGVAHLRLVIGSSMGGMHAWMWAEMYPDLMDGVVPISCQPGERSGRKWLARRAQADAIRHDPDWNGGFYETNPRHYIYAAAGNFGTESPTRIQEMAPTLAAANALYERRLAEAAKGDANNQLWAIEAIMDYNPEPDVDKITAKVMLINDAEDHANPPELGTVERAMKRVKHGRYVLIPAGPKTHGHFSHFYAELWKPYLIEFMQTLGPRCRRPPNRRGHRL